MANITKTTADVFIPEIWSPEVKRAVESNLVMAKLVNRNFEGEIQKYGDTVRVANISHLSVGSKSASTDVTFEAITETSNTILIDQHAYAAFKEEDIVAIQSNVNLMSEYSNQIGYALAKDVDTKLLALYSGLSQSVGTSGTAISNANFLAAIKLLDLADAPETNRSGVFNSGDKADFLAVDQFVRYDATGIGGPQSAIVKGNFGELYGVGIYFSTNVTTTGSPTGKHNLVFHKDAFTLAMQRDVRIQSQYAVESLATKVVGDILYGVLEWRDTFGVVYRS